MNKGSKGVSMRQSTKKKKGFFQLNVTFAKSDKK